MPLAIILLAVLVTTFGAGGLLAYRWLRPASGERWTPADLRAVGFSGAFIGTILSMIALAALGFLSGAWLAQSAP